MAQVEQVVGQQLIGATDVVGPADCGERRIGQLAEIGNHRGIGCGVAEPHPDPAMAFDHGKRGPAPPGDHRLAGNGDARAGAVEAHAVVGALDRLPDDGAERQRQVTVRAVVGERRDSARRGAEDDERLAADGPRERPVGQVARPFDDVPAVADERIPGRGCCRLHDRLPFARAATPSPPLKHAPVLRAVADRHLWKRRHAAASDTPEASAAP